MSTLSPAGQDRLLMFGLGLTACAVVGLMRHLLVQYRDDAIEKPVRGKPQYITQEVEDSLKLGTLAKLLKSTSHGIQDTASTIICERAVHDGSTIDILLWYIAQPDYESREQGVRALVHIMSTCSPILHLLNTPKGYSALVTSLQYSVDDYKHNVYDPDWDNWELRDMCERGCLMILGQLSDHYGVKGLVRAGFIEKWLAKEPWGGRNEDERQLAFMDSLAKDTRLADIAMPLFRDEAARLRLEATRLLPPRLEEQILDAGHVSSVKDVRMVGGEGTSGEGEEGDHFVQAFVEGLRRPRESSVEEAVVRQRHREAMVLNDGSRPLGRADIIERQR
ncbi:hypothetical protein BP5796_07467 [Coleophoma crateriformis]|uniref:Cytoskeleton-associated protein n=1 Tax=Coleophoma crateriformis TaxID=565419 RepID=A0A3D8RJ04_9HELO|nr:hypothetical protein BP5796_07467 [Coleophoma crateriformis]